MGFPLHKPYPYSLYRFSDSSILGTTSMLGDFSETRTMKQPLATVQSTKVPN